MVHHMVSFVLYFYIFLFFFLQDIYFKPHHELVQPSTINFPPQVLMNVDQRIGRGRGITITINHCSTLTSHKRGALIMEDMLETYFPGVKVILDIQTPGLHNRGHIRAIRLGGLTIILVGEQLFQRMGIPRIWFIVLVIRNRLLWKIENMAVGLLQQTNAFEVYFNGELIFSKLKEGRFPTELELRELVAGKLVDSTVADGVGAGVLWS